MELHFVLKAQHEREAFYCALRRWLAVVITVSTAVPAFIVLLCNDLKAVAKRFSLFDAYQSLDNLLNCTHLISDSCACRKSSVDSKLSSFSRSYRKYRSRIAVK
jgi:hypothetical protein